MQASGNSQLRRLSPSRHSSTTAPAGHLLCIHLHLIMIIHPCQAPPMDFPGRRLRKIKEAHSHAARASRGTGRSPAAQPRRQTVQAIGNSPPRSHNARPCRQWESLYYAASAPDRAGNGKFPAAQPQCRGKRAEGNSRPRRARPCRTGEVPSRAASTPNRARPCRQWEVPSRAATVPG